MIGVPDKNLLWRTPAALSLSAQESIKIRRSVRRLVRDGVDAPLAKLFVHVARSFSQEAEGLLALAAQVRRSFIAD